MDVNGYVVAWPVRPYRISIATATFGDEMIVVMHVGAENDPVLGTLRPRQRYCYTVISNGTVVDYRDDLRSCVSADVDAWGMLRSLVSFLCADAQAYRAQMSGTPIQEWAYQNDGELAELADELEPKDCELESL